MDHKYAPGSARARLVRLSLALAFAVSPITGGRPGVAQSPAPEAPLKAETQELSTLTAPAGLAALARPSASHLPSAPLGQAMGAEIEPNGFYTQATPIVSGATIRASIYPNADVDYYSFTARAGDRVYAAIMGAFSANGSNDSQLSVIGPDGVTVIEFDDDNGTLGPSSSSIAGAVTPFNGTYFLKVNHQSAANQLRPYELHFRLRSGSPTAEAEPNDSPATANTLAPGGWMSGARNPAVSSEEDYFSVTLAAGDTVFLSLDLDPERDGVAWNGRLGFGLFGDDLVTVLAVNDSGASDAIPSEALFMTVKDAGIYYAYVDSSEAATGGITATYRLSVDVKPRFDEGPVCVLYTSTDVPKSLGPGTGLSRSTLTVPGHPRIADLDVTLNLTHAQMSDLDVHLRSPADNDNGLFSDIGAAAAGGQNVMDNTFDDEAGAPPAFTFLRGLTVKPELAYRLGWFDGEDAGGEWTLELRDDGANANGGTLLGWSIRVCEPPPPPSCPVGFSLATIYSADFEAGDGGFTHGGAFDEWQRGLPNTAATTATNPTAPFTTCNSGSGCWKTDLTGSYEINAFQNLTSPIISLAPFTAPIQVTWAQRYQIENATFDHAYVDIGQPGGGTTIRLWEWLDGTMADNSIGNPTLNVPASAGWGLRSGRADSLAGSNAQLVFHLDSDNSFSLGGLAIDDVMVQGCVAYVYIPRVLR